jgi:hypothetical protein
VRLRRHRREETPKVRHGARVGWARPGGDYSKECMLVIDVTKEEMFECLKARFGSNNVKPVATDGVAIHYKGRLPVVLNYAQAKYLCLHPECDKDLRSGDLSAWKVV